MTRTYGRAPRGERVVGTVPGRWTTMTLISALRLSGVMAPLTFEGATDTPAFQTYVAQVLAPRLQPGDVVIWDNLKPHQDAEVKQRGRRRRRGPRRPCPRQWVRHCGRFTPRTFWDGFGSVAGVAGRNRGLLILGTSPTADPILAVVCAQPNRELR